MKNYVWLVILGGVVFLLVAVFLFSSPYDRVDVVGSDDFVFRLKNWASNYNFNTVGHVIERNIWWEDGLVLIDVPRNITMLCGNREALALVIQNNNNYMIDDFKFVVDDFEGLDFEFPKNFVIPPDSSRKMTFFVDSGCTGHLQEIKPIVRLLNSDVEFTMNIIVEDKLE